MQIGPGSTVGGKYVLERPLARGGKGAVWVARHAKLGSMVAVKFLDAHLAASAAMVTRFEREARAAATLDTPHVVKVHDYGVDLGVPYLVMELLRGEDLSTRLRARGRLPLAEAGRILVQMSRALRRAHEAGIVHRDLKPANVFLARLEEDEEIVKILDFGIAKEAWTRAEETTKTGEVFGSPHYMSPEQARAEKTVDHRADIWAVGVIAYRMLTGKLPFPGEAVGEVLSHVLVDPFPPLSRVAPDLPPALSGFFSRALAKRPQDRFASIGDLIESFRTILGEATGRQSLAEIHAALRTLDPSAPPVLVPGPPGPPGPLPAAPLKPSTTAAPTAVVPSKAVPPGRPAPAATPPKPAPAATPPKPAPAAAAPKPGPDAAAPPKPAAAVVVPAPPAAARPAQPEPSAAAAPPRIGPPASRPKLAEKTPSSAEPAKSPSVVAAAPARPAPPAPPPRAASTVVSAPTSPGPASPAPVAPMPPKRNAPVIVPPAAAAVAPAGPAPAAAAATNHPAPAAAQRTDSTAPTALFLRADAPTAPLPPPPAVPDLQSAVEKTGPSLANATSSVVPEQPRPQRNRRVAGAVVACGLVAVFIGVWATRGPDTPAPEPAAPDATAPTLAPTAEAPPAVTQSARTPDPPASTAEAPSAGTQSARAPDPPAPTAGASSTAMQSPPSTPATTVAAPVKTPQKKVPVKAKPGASATKKGPNLGI